MPSASNHHLSSTRSTNRRKNVNRTESHGQTEKPVQCYACTQVGVPAFHSTSCDALNQPEWEAYSGSSLFPGKSTKPGNPYRSSSFMGKVLDPRSETVMKWNRVFLLTRGLSVIVDPLLFFAVSLIAVNGGAPCLHMDREYALGVTVLRTVIDMVHLLYLWLQFKVAYVSRESLAVGRGKLVWDRRAIAWHYLRSLKGFGLDIYVILPIPQILLWKMLPLYIEKNQINPVLTMFLIIFLAQFIPKAYHIFALMRNMRKATGYIFGSVWYGFAMNLIGYLMVAHIFGGLWYILATQRLNTCLREQCERNPLCDVVNACANACNGTLSSCVANTTVLETSSCMDTKSPFQFGIFGSLIPALLTYSVATRAFYSTYWGMTAMSSFGNELEPSCTVVDSLVSIVATVVGFTLFSLLVGNIQVLLNVILFRHEEMQMRRQGFEWWMKRRQLPQSLRKRIRHYERHRPLVTGGEEMAWIEDLPEGLRRDIKRYLCLDLIKKVPLFQHLDEMILDSICDRVKHFTLSKDEKIIREGDLVQKMVFIVRGRVVRTQRLYKSVTVTSTLEPGSFLGDEVLSWCIRRTSMDSLPTASATFICLESTEVFGIDADNLREITDNFRYKFASSRLKHMTRYYSSNWRAWAAVTIQMAWRRYRARKIYLRGQNKVSSVDERMRKYALVFLSLKPRDQLL